MNWFDRIVLLLTGLTALYLIWQFYGCYRVEKTLYDIYHMMGFAVLFVSGVLLIFLGLGILTSPLVLTVATLIPLGISMGLMNQFMPEYKKIYSWFALLGFLAIAISSITGSPLKKFAVPIFHGVAGLIIFGLPLYLCIVKKNVPQGFGLVGVGGLLIGIGGIALAFLTAGSQLLLGKPGCVA